MKANLKVGASTVLLAIAIAALWLLLDFHEPDLLWILYVAFFCAVSWIAINRSRRSSIEKIAWDLQEQKQNQPAQPIDSNETVVD